MMTEQESSLADKCLIATPAIQDGLFAESLVYLCEHNNDGCMGLVVNHRTTQVLNDIFVQLNISCDDTDIQNQPVYLGGPVKIEQGFVLHSNDGRWQGTVDVSDDIKLTSSLDILEDIAGKRGPKHYLVTLGFSGWAPGQLESELQQNSWLTSNSSSDLLFDVEPDKRWQKAFDSLGFDISNLSPVSGNA
jgi:putative transcriptional regulator